MKMCKMKQVCAASPGKFASVLLDILDGSILESPARSATMPVVTPEKKGAKGKAAVRKRAAAIAAQGERSAKKAKVMREDKTKKIEEEKLAADRKKQLQSVKPLSKLKEMAQSKGLECGKKTQMIESIITFESKARENVRRHKANAKDIVAKKREEFTGKPQKKLKELLRAYGLLTGGGKPQMVDRLLATWKEQGDLEKMLVAMAFQARQAELSTIDKVALYDMCCKRGVDALSKDVLVDRLLIHESAGIWQEVVEAHRQLV